MGNYSRDTYKINRDKHYVSVRSQQGIPLVDADWNEMDDIRKYELQNFIMSFIGNGTFIRNGPVVGDDFRIRAYGHNNNFIIFPGYCLVSGQIVINNEDISYSDQQLPDKQELPLLKAPQNNTRIDTIYLEMWEREVNSDEDKDLKLKYAGNELETCVRIKREWVVKVAEGVEGSYEAATLPDYDPHYFRYILAYLIRYVNEEAISDNNIIDKRFVGLNLEALTTRYDLNRIHKVPLLQKTLFGARPQASVPIEGKGPSGVAFDGTHIWVTNRESNNLSKIDITNNVVTAVNIGEPSCDITFDGRDIWVTNNLGDGVKRIDLDKPDEWQYFKPGPSPVGIAVISPYNYSNIPVLGVSEFCYVANNGSNYISKIDAGTGKNTDIEVGSAPYGIVFDGEHIWVANSGSNTVSKINVTSDAVVETIPVLSDPRCIAFDGQSIWVTHNGINTVTKIDPLIMATIAKIRVGHNPLGVAFDGTNIWVANYGSNTVSKIDITYNKELARVNVGSNPSGIAFDGTHIWVANYGSNTVSKIRKII